MAAEGRAEHPRGMTTTAHENAHLHPYAMEIADAVRSGRRTAVMTTQQHLTDVDRLDPELNAFQAVRHTAALAEAAEVDADPGRARLPLAGVPVVVKDNIAVAGESARHGSAASSSAPSTE